MRFSAASLFIGAAAAAPALSVPAAPAISDVKILGVTAIGTGCPVGHAFVNVDATGTIFDVAFDQYFSSVGPGSSPADARKNCRVSINLKFPAGYQLSIIETRFQGYASLTDGQTGTCRAGYTFAGDSSQEVVFQKNLVAPYDDNYNLVAGVGVESYTQCGGTTAILNVNSEVRITPVTSPYKGLMTVRSPYKLAVRWRRCDAASGNPEDS
ncbi:hypothetical protein B0H67DRAFT_549857 [Lasiosphaeris hirsuta]|uniref:Secreted protein n=1 Tax=Lasiosphaeris hirsuta TaxID=260670 RepID=A0AA40BDK0_9PEZI|nr:hypothetical protein B0H67DRAFT_549857 [Lasiosphaeris hirsuta]